MNLPRDRANTPNREMRDVPDEAYFDDRIAARAVKALRDLHKRNGPWFLAVGFWKPHAHFNAPRITGTCTTTVSTLANTRCGPKTSNFVLDADMKTNPLCR